MRDLFSFPNPVNEKAARVVAGTVVLASLLALATQWHWLLAVLAAGFVARVFTGPTLSPLGRFAMWFARRYLGEPKYVAGPPKRFAQGMGATMTTAGAVLGLGFGLDTVANLVLVGMVLAAGLESLFAYCVGCKIFALLTRAGMVPETVCAECADIRLRQSAA